MGGQGESDMGTPSPRALLVDDMEENLVALEAILRSLDLVLVRARSGEEALKALLRDEFAVVLLDVVMPGMDGFETASHIKRLDQTKDIPVIFLTAIDSAPAYAFRGYAAGAADYLTKPFDPWVLRAKVEVFIDLYRKNQRIREQAAALRTGIGDPFAVLARLRRLEETAEAVRASLDGTAAPETADLMTDLVKQVAELRDTIGCLPFA
jgi:CheY-like chemotaxis protein